MAILEIVLLIILRLIEGINAAPPDVRAAMWERHEQRLKFWEDLFAQLRAEDETAAK